MANRIAARNKKMCASVSVDLALSRIENTPLGNKRERKREMQLR